MNQSVVVFLLRTQSGDLEPIRKTVKAASLCRLYRRIGMRRLRFSDRHLISFRQYTWESSLQAENPAESSTPVPREHCIQAGTDAHIYRAGCGLHSTIFWLIIRSISSTRRSHEFSLATATRCRCRPTSSSARAWSIRATKASGVAAM